MINFLVTHLHTCRYQGVKRKTICRNFGVLNNFYLFKNSRSCQFHFRRGSLRKPLPATPCTGCSSWIKSEMESRITWQHVWNIFLWPYLILARLLQQFSNYLIFLKLCILFTLLQKKQYLNNWLKNIIK